MRAIGRNENAERRHHGGIRRNAEDLGLQPRPTEQPADQRPSKQRKDKDAEPGRTGHVPAPGWLRYGQPCGFFGGSLSNNSGHKSSINSRMGSESA